MGQIVAFPIPPGSYPDLTANLETADCILLSAIRSWVAAYKEGENPIPRLCQGLQTAGAPNAAFSINDLMTALARAVIRPVDIHCPRCPHLSPDEKHLLRAASLTQAGDSHLAEKVLRTTLLSAQGTELAIGPLEDLGELFTRARLFLSCRRWRAEGHEMGDDRQSWSPPHSLH
jgi:hypothetical protein